MIKYLNILFILYEMTPRAHIWIFFENMIGKKICMFILNSNVVHLVYVCVF